MAFEKRIWVDVPDPNNPPAGAITLDATELNRIEGGIDDNDKEIKKRVLEETFENRLAIHADFAHTASPSFLRDPVFEAVADETKREFFNRLARPLSGTANLSSDGNSYIYNKNTAYAYRFNEISCSFIGRKNNIVFYILKSICTGSYGSVEYNAGAYYAIVEYDLDNGGQWSFFSDVFQYGTGSGSLISVDSIIVFADDECYICQLKSYKTSGDSSGYIHGLLFSKIKRGDSTAVVFARAQTELISSFCYQYLRGVYTKGKFYLGAFSQSNYTNNYWQFQEVLFSISMEELLHPNNINVYSSVFGNYVDYSTFSLGKNRVVANTTQNEHPSSVFGTFYSNDYIFVLGEEIEEGTDGSLIPVSDSVRTKNKLYGFDDNSGLCLDSKQQSIYQGIWDFNTGKIKTVFSMLRWLPPSGNYIDKKHFYPKDESTFIYSGFLYMPISNTYFRVKIT